MKKLDLPTIGEILETEFLEPFNLSQNALALAIGVPSNRISGIVKGLRGISADTDLRLTRYFGLSEGYFLRIQERIKLAQAKQALGDALNKIVPLDSFRKARKDEQEELLQG